MIKKFEQNITYICPTCSTTTDKVLNVFDFSGKSTIDFYCSKKDCNKKVMSITQTQNKCHIVLECPFCSGEHNYTLKKSLFWTKDLFCFNCPISDMQMLFIGNPDKIKNELNNQETLIGEMFTQFERENGASMILSIISEIDQMLVEGSIKCECGADNIDADIQNKGIVLKCEGCGASKLIEFTEEAYEELMNNDAIVIKK